MSGSAQRARLLLGQQRYDLAEQEWRKVLGEDPDDAEAHAGLALCLCERERFDEAEAESRLALAAAPRADFVHYVSAHVLRARKRFAEAHAAIAEAIALDPHDADYRAFLAGLHAQRAEWSECLVAADAGLALDPESDGCANWRALALTHLDRRDEAGEAIAGALARSPENSLTHANQGWALLHRSQPKEALGHFREALRLDPSNDWAREGLLTALKAHNPLYRQVLAFLLFMSRQGALARWGIAIGLVFGQQLLDGLARANPSLALVLYPLFYLLLACIFLTWLANPLMNLAMRAHPDGRHALTADQRGQSTLIALCLCVAALSLIFEVLHGIPHRPSMMLMFLTIPIIAVHNGERGWPRLVAGGVATAFAVMAAIVATTYHIGDWLQEHHQRATVAVLLAMSVRIIGFYFIGILAWSFLGPMLNRVEPTR